MVKNNRQSHLVAEMSASQSHLIVLNYFYQNLTTKKQLRSHRSSSHQTAKI